MPSTPSRGYTYPTTSSPATVPADLRVPLEQVDADVQTLVDQIEGAVRLNEDGSLPEAVEERVEQIAVAFGSPAGAIPIFPTLAEAEAWEVANPGRTALTLEPQTPDVTPPVPGTLHVVPAHDSATLSVDGASDDRGVTGYSFRRDGGAWTGWQGEPEHTMEGLAPATGYSFQHRVRDRAGNETAGAAVSATTPETPPTSPGDIGSLLASWDMDEASTTGGAITGVPDSVGGRTLVPASSAPPLISAGGHQWAAFSASSAQRLRWLGTFPAPLPEHTLCIILRPGTTSGTVASSAYTSAEVTGSGLTGRNTSVVSSVLADSAEAVLLTVAVTGTQVTTRVGGVTQVGTGATTALTSNFSLGATYGSGGAGFTSATIGRAWIHSKAITDAEHLALTEWARAEWGTL